MADALMDQSFYTPFEHVISELTIPEPQPFDLGATNILREKYGVACMCAVSGTDNGWRTVGSVRHKEKWAMVESKTYDRDPDRYVAYYLPLTPARFLRRTAGVIHEHVAVIHGNLRRCWRDTDLRCRARLALFNCPMTTIFTELLKISTGKIKKFVLRERTLALESSAPA